jgi:anti-sigma B factor antagonist
MKKTAYEEAGIIVLEPAGELVGGVETDELRSTIDQQINAGNTRLVIDLGKVQYINSTALGLLTATHVNYAKRNGRVILCQVEKRIQNIFIITKLSMIFDLFPNQHEALASFSR